MPLSIIVSSCWFNESRSRSTVKSINDLQKTIYYFLNYVHISTFDLIVVSRATWHNPKYLPFHFSRKVQWNQHASSLLHRKLYRFYAMSWIQYWIRTFFSLWVFDRILNKYWIWYQIAILSFHEFFHLGQWKVYMEVCIRRMSKNHDLRIISVQIVNTKRVVGKYW